MRKLGRASRAVRFSAYASAIVSVLAVATLSVLIPADSTKRDGMSVPAGLSATSARLTGPTVATSSPTVAPSSGSLISSGSPALPQIPSQVISMVESRGHLTLQVSTTVPGVLSLSDAEATQLQASPWGSYPFIEASFVTYTDQQTQASGDGWLLSSDVSNPPQAIGAGQIAPPMDGSDAPASPAHTAVDTSSADYYRISLIDAQSSQVVAELEGWDPAIASN